MYLSLKHCFMIWKQYTVLATVCVFVHTSTLFGHSTLPLSDVYCIQWQTQDLVMVISQVDPSTPWGIDSVWLSQDITKQYIWLHRHHKPMKMITFDTHDSPSLLWQHALIFLLWHALPCGCYSSQIYHFNGGVVRPEDYLRHKYIIVCSFGIDRVSLCPD